MHFIPWFRRAAPFFFLILLAGILAFFVQRVTAKHAGARYEACVSKLPAHADTAMTDAETWARESPDSPLPLHCRALALAGLGRFAEAGALLASLAAQSAADSDLSLRLTLQASGAYEEGGQYDVSANVLTTALMPANDHWSRGEKARLVTARAAIYRSQRQPLAAIQDLDYALAIEGDKAYILTERARAYLALGETRSAWADVQNALKLEPSNAEAQALLTEMPKQSPLATLHR